MVVNRTVKPEDSHRAGRVENTARGGRSNGVLTVAKSGAIPPTPPRLSVAISDRRSTVGTGSPAESIAPVVDRRSTMTVAESANGT